MMNLAVAVTSLIFLVVQYQLYNVQAVVDPAPDPKETTEECKCTSECSRVFSIFSDHTACVEPSPTAKPIAITDTIRKQIVDKHNELRSQVTPIAINMLKMTWDAEIAMLAEKWANACKKRNGQFYHDDVRNIPGKVTVGQNIGTNYNSFDDVIMAWYNEVNDYTYNVTIDGSYSGPDIGHYTQIVWASTNKIGCAVTDCDGSMFHVCNYSPMGNLFPYDKPYETGQSSCSACSKCDGQLCDCGDLTCRNGGTLKTSSCTCECKNPEIHTGETCELNCDGKDTFYCGTGNFIKSKCTAAFVYQDCPHLCGLCPCAESDFANAECEASLATPAILTLTLAFFVFYVMF